MSDFSSGKRNRTLELNKALTVMGFGTWNSLEPDTEKMSKDKKGPESINQEAIVDKLNKTMFNRLQEIEAKRERATALERKLSKMADGPKKRQITYQKQQEDALALKYHRTPVDEERALHEAYQILLREVEYRKSKGDRAPTSNQTTETKAEPSVTEAEEDPSEDFSGDEYTDPIKPSKVSSVKTSAPKKRTKSNS